MFFMFLMLALCLDTFTSSLAYGVNETKIPVGSMCLIGLICSVALVVSTGIAAAAKQWIPAGATELICFLIFFSLGVIKSFESFLKKYISKRQDNAGQIKVKLFDLNFVLTVYADNSKADIDHSKVLSAKEAVYLALALSLDGFAAGFGFGLTEINYVELIGLSFGSNLLAVFLGSTTGKCLAKLTSFDFSWLGGVILILLAFTKLIN
jgi:putative sporulation protein YtaF